MAKTYLGSETILIKKYVDENGKEEVHCNLTEKQKKLIKEMI